jgi:hypothetical protein
VDEQELIKYRLYLLGYNVEGMGRLVSQEDERLPLLATPFRRHLNEVNRFLFDGGVNVDTRTSGPKQDWVNEQVLRLNLSKTLENLWEQVAIYGKAYIGLHPDGNGHYKWVLYTSYNVKEDKVECYATDEKGLVWRTDYEPFSYGIYSPQKGNDFALGKKAHRKEYPHNYPFAPGFEIKNSRGPEFDLAAIEMATEIAVQTSAAAENFYYFGNQIIATPNRNEALEAIANRTRVLTREPESEGGVPTVLDVKATPETFIKLLENLNASLADHLGSPIVHLNLRSDLSSLTLKLTYSGTIGTAQKKWQALITEGVEPIFGKMLLMAAYDEQLGSVSASDPETYKVSIMRSQPYFKESAMDRAQQLEVVDKLISLGVRPTYALASEYYTSLTEAQVDDLLGPRLSTPSEE